MTSGLILYIVVIVVDFAGLAFDASLKYIFKVPTVSGRIWAWDAIPGHFPLWSLVIIGWHFLGCVGLAMHFYILRGRA